MNLWTQIHHEISTIRTVAVQNHFPVLWLQSKKLQHQKLNSNCCSTVVRRNWIQKITLEVTSSCGSCKNSKVSRVHRDLQQGAKSCITVTGFSSRFPPLHWCHNSLDIDGYVNEHLYHLSAYCIPITCWVVHYCTHCAYYWVITLANINLLIWFICLLNWRKNTDREEGRNISWRVSSSYPRID